MRCAGDGWLRKNQRVHRHAAGGVGSRWGSKSERHSRLATPGGRLRRGMGYMWTRCQIVGDLWKPTGVNQAHGVNGNANIKLNGHILLGAGKTPVH